MQKEKRRLYSFKTISLLQPSRLIEVAIIFGFRNFFRSTEPGKTHLPIAKLGVVTPSFIDSYESMMVYEATFVASLILLHHDEIPLSSITRNNGNGVAAFDSYDSYLEIHLLFLEIVIDGLGGFLCRDLICENLCLYHDDSSLEIDRKIIKRERIRCSVRA